MYNIKNLVERLNSKVFFVKGGSDYVAMDAKTKKHFTGIYRQFYETGSLKSKSYFSLGIHHGIYLAYYRNGQLKERAWFRIGWPTGMFISFFENGKLRSRGFTIFCETKFC